MKHARISILAVALFAAQAGCGANAQDQAAPSFKRLLSECMSRKMASNKTLSYNDAGKLCKQQIKSQRDESAANGVPKPVGGR